MEPAKVNHTEAGDSLEQLLRETAPRIANQGFSNRVMTAVDASRRQSRIRLCVIMIGGATGLAVAAGAGAFGSGGRYFSTDLQRSFANLTAVAANPAVVLAAFIIIAALVYVFRRHESDASSR